MDELRKHIINLLLKIDIKHLPHFGFELFGNEFFNREYNLKYDYTTEICSRYENPNYKPSENKWNCLVKEAIKFLKRTYPENDYSADEEFFFKDGELKFTPLLYDEWDEIIEESHKFFLNRKNQIKRFREGLKDDISFYVTNGCIKDRPEFFVNRIITGGELNSKFIEKNPLKIVIEPYLFNGTDVNIEYTEYLSTIKETEKFRYYTESFKTFNELSMLILENNKLERGFVIQQDIFLNENIEYLSDFLKQVINRFWNIKEIGKESPFVIFLNLMTETHIDKNICDDIDFCDEKISLLPKFNLIKMWDVIEYYRKRLKKTCEVYPEFESWTYNDVIKKIEIN